jgi:tetratricopeptide (TPR) repeat protein
VDAALGGAGNIPGPSGSLSRSGLRRAAVAAGLGVAMFAAGAVGIVRGSSSPEPVTIGRSGGSSIGSLVAAPGLPIEALQRRLQAVPADWRSWAVLGLAYVQEARVTADPRYYPKAEGSLARSLELRPNPNLEAAIGHGALALARHRFGAALHWGQQAGRSNPFSNSAYGIIGDAQLELGRYRQAFATLQRMVDVKPDVASYSRASYVRELQGDVSGAKVAMRLALTAASTPEDRAFAAYHLGELAWNDGRPAEAAPWYRMSRALAPEYSPPVAGLAKVAWAEGRTEDAIVLYRRVVHSAPLPEYATALGDLYAETGRPVLAGRLYDVVMAEQRLLRDAGVNVDLELTLFDADHGRPRAALIAATAEWRRRHSIHAADALAWALYRNGRYAAASRYANQATKLGTRNAMFHFHAGMIELARDRLAGARRHLAAALDINPHFSILHSDVAARTLRQLGGRP